MAKKQSKKVLKAQKKARQEAKKLTKRKEVKQVQSSLKSLGYSSDTVKKVKTKGKAKEIIAKDFGSENAKAFESKGKILSTRREINAAVRNVIDKAIGTDKKALKNYTSGRYLKEEKALIEKDLRDGVPIEDIMAELKKGSKGKYINASKRAEKWAKDGKVTTTTNSRGFTKTSKRTYSSRDKQMIKTLGIMFNDARASTSTGDRRKKEIESYGKIALGLMNLHGLSPEEAISLMMEMNNKNTGRFEYDDSISGYSNVLSTI